MEFFRRLGAVVLARVSAFLDVCGVIATAARAPLALPARGGRAASSVLIKQVYFTGFESLPIVSWIALVLGLIIVTQTLSLVPRLGGESLVGDVFVWVVVRELGPLFASVIVIARSGTAISSELATMRLSRQITALELMGIDPARYLVAPRVAGTALSVVVLTFYFESVAILGGYILAGPGKNITFVVYIQSIMEAMGFLEAAVTVVKSALFGVIIGAVCSYHGLMAKRSLTQIPQETTNAVIGSLKAVFVADAAITFVFFM